MIRVGFLMTQRNSDWLGGVNYLNNLLRAILSINGRKIEPVVFISPDVPRSLLQGFPAVEFIESRILSPVLGKFARKVGQRILGRDFLLEWLLKYHDIAVLSHSGDMGRYSRVPTIGWIPDFQHIHLPDFFERWEIRRRDAEFARFSYCNTTIVLSSRDALRDFAKVAPHAVSKCRVLQFSSLLSQAAEASRQEMLVVKYGLRGRFFYVPNQFWVHKNHRVIIDALAELKARGQIPLVVATGRPNDRRHPGYFDELIRYAKDKGVIDSFVVLGLIPLEDLFGLMRGAVAVINSSFFEGWSTTVEEGKSLGKKMILSDIAVHREQAPDRVIYFNPRDGTELANALLTALEEYSVEAEDAFTTLASEAWLRRAQSFGETYQKIVLETLTTHRP